MEKFGLVIEFNIEQRGLWDTYFKQTLPVLVQIE